MPGVIGSEFSVVMNRLIPEKFGKDVTLYHDSYNELYESWMEVIMSGRLSISDDSSSFDRRRFFEAVQEGLSNIASGDVFSTDELRQELDLTGDNWKNAGDPSC